MSWSAMMLVGATLCIASRKVWNSQSKLDANAYLTKPQPNMNDCPCLLIAMNGAKGMSYMLIIYVVSKEIQS